MYSVPGDTTSLVPGFPIRTPSDHRSVDSSPRHFAASHVLHRLPVPRHPPCALKHLQRYSVHKNSVQTNLEKLHIRKQQPHPRHPSRKRRSRRLGCCSLDARNHYPRIKHHTPPPKQGDNNPPLTGHPPRSLGVRKNTPGSPTNRAKR